MGARGVALLAAVLVAACAQTPAARTTPSPQPTASVKMSAATSPTHVFVVVMENAGYQVALAQPGIAGLAQKYGLATNYHAVSHPSLPNYLALTAGSTFGIADDAYHALPATGIGSQLDAARVSWRAYFQGMSRGCLQSPPPYALKHNPFAYYGGACPTSGQVVDFAELGPDLALPAAQAPRLAWITPISATTATTADRRPATASFSSSCRRSPPQPPGRRAGCSSSPGTRTMAPPATTSHCW